MTNSAYFVTQIALYSTQYLHSLSTTSFIPYIHVRPQGGGKSKRSPPPSWKIRIVFNIGDLFARFYPYGGLFLTFFNLMRGSFATFSPCRGLFCYFFCFVRAFLGLYGGPLWSLPHPNFCGAHAYIALPFLHCPSSPTHTVLPCSSS